jgi:DNA-binding response OmpR family regulator
MLGESPDLIFVDYHLPGMNGLDFVVASKARGYSGPLIVLTGDTSPDLRERALGVGAAELLHKPCSKDLLHQAAAEYLIAGASQQNRGHGPLIASAKEVGLTLELLQMYVDDLKNFSASIQKCIADADLEKLRALAVQIRSSAKGHGYGSVGQAATDLLRTLDATGCVEESANAARRLDEFCRRAKATD